MENRADCGFHLQQDEQVIYEEAATFWKGKGGIRALLGVFQRNEGCIILTDKRLIIVRARLSEFIRTASPRKGAPGSDADGYNWVEDKPVVSFNKIDIIDVSYTTSKFGAGMIIETKENGIWSFTTRNDNVEKWVTLLK